MDTLEDYLSGTESAVIALFNGIDSYIQILRDAPKPILHVRGSVSHDSISREEFDKIFDSWRAKNIESIELSYTKQREFFAESFALNALCGSLLQIASMGIQLFSQSHEPPEDLPQELKPLISKNKNALKFCVGRRFRNLPIGLLIYAGRNQYSHMDEKKLMPLNKEILSRLLPDPDSFDLRSTRLMNFSIRITGLLDWRSYESYKSDMNSLIL